MLRSAIVRSATAGACLLVWAGLLPLTGCHDDDHPYSPVYEEGPKIWAIEVDERDNATPHLEVEVHLYDARSGRLLGCSGDSDGLDIVNHRHVLYRVDAHFVSPGHHHRLTWSEIAGRDLFVRVYEDDHDACPAPPGNLDDFIGQSPAFTADEMADGLALRFDDVLYLELGLDY